MLNKILAQAETPKNAKTSQRIVQGAGNQSLATADLADALEELIYKCWSPPIGVSNANDLVVDFDLQPRFAMETVSGAATIIRKLKKQQTGQSSNT